MSYAVLRDQSTPRRHNPTGRTFDALLLFLTADDSRDTGSSAFHRAPHRLQCKVTKPLARPPTGANRVPKSADACCYRGRLAYCTLAQVILPHKRLAGADVPLKSFAVPLMNFLNSVRTVVYVQHKDVGSNARNYRQLISSICEFC